MKKLISFILVLTLFSQVAWSQAQPNQGQQGGYGPNNQVLWMDTDTRDLMTRILESTIIYGAGMWLGTEGAIAAGILAGKIARVTMFGIGKVIDWARGPEAKSPLSVAIYLSYLRSAEKQLTEQLWLLRESLVSHQVSASPENPDPYGCYDDGAESPARDVPLLDLDREKIEKCTKAYTRLIESICGDVGSSKCSLPSTLLSSYQLSAAQINMGILRTKLSALRKVLELRLKAAQVLLLDIQLAVKKAERDLENADARVDLDVLKFLSKKDNVDGLSQAEVENIRLKLIASTMETLALERNSSLQHLEFMRSETKRLKEENQRLSDEINALLVP